MAETPKSYLNIYEITSSAPTTNNNNEQALSGSLEAIRHGFNHSYEDESEHGYLDSFPPGYRFMPTDEELYSCYLLPKLTNGRLPRNRFHEVNVYLHSPEELTETYRSQGENTWFFFTQRIRKYPKGGRPDRAVQDENGTGFWKATSAAKDFKDKDGNEVFSKKSLVYYKRKGRRDEKQPWKMHEYLASGQSIKANGKEWKLDDCVLCKIYMSKKKHDGGNNDEREPQTRTQVQIHEDVGNEEQGLVEKDSPGSDTNILMETGNANNNFPTYNCESHNYENGYTSLPLPNPYIPYYPNTGYMPPIPEIYCGNNDTNFMGHFEPMPSVDQGQQPYDDGMQWVQQPYVDQNELSLMFTDGNQLQQPYEDENQWQLLEDTTDLSHNTGVNQSLQQPSI